jgi:hypothetical protein
LAAAFNRLAGGWGVTTLEAGNIHLLRCQNNMIHQHLLCIKGLKTSVISSAVRKTNDAHVAGLKKTKAGLEPAFIQPKHPKL